MIKCGHCGSGHATIAQVKACSTATVLVVSREEFASNVLSAFDPTPLPTIADWEDVKRQARAEEARRDREDNRHAADAKQAREDAANLPEEDLSYSLERVLELLDTRVVEPRYARSIRDWATSGGVVTAFGARTAIARLEACPVKGGVPVTEEGLYRRNGKLYQVVRSQGSERLYAKLVTFPPEGSKKRPTLTYVRGEIYNLTADQLLPIEEAQEITRKTGWCVFGHFLTKPESIARGMGDTCYSRYPHLAKTA